MQDVLAAVEAAVVEHFGHRPARASVSFVGVDPIEVLRFEPIPGERAFVTLGMSRHPMTGASAEIVNADGPRAELMLHVRDPGDDHADVWRRLAVLAAAPAVEGVVYVDGMSVELGEPLVAGSAEVGVVITPSALDDVGTDAGTVTILQAVPATSNELGWCRVRGSEALRERWREADADLLDLLRHSVALD
ncbi:suppressor of fused domain protein [uncultured Jatrophihabitans sp.]|uniref:suppressor of fused domain protein n=1 Tax=uncultured Jatrophihabitans sp. TaxID=1610747 RepID=UPI0035CAC450